MSGVFLLLLAFLLTLGTLIALGGGFGYLLHWLLPDLELEMALRVGVGPKHLLTVVSLAPGISPH